MVVVSIIQFENEILVPERIFNNHQTLGVWGRDDTAAGTSILSSLNLIIKKNTIK